MLTTPRLLAVAAVAAFALTLASAPSASAPGAPAGGDGLTDLEQRGRELFLTGCATCHGAGGEGTDLGPTVIGAGEAGVDFMLRTGRMPSAAPAGQQPSKPVAYDDDEIEALVAYVGGLGEGPEIPDIDPSAGDRAVGGELYRANCQACHNAAGIGGVLSDGQYAPPLLDVDLTQVAEAVRFGPGEMPVFDEDTFSDDQLTDIVSYVGYLQEPESPGGLRIGGVGPVSEGLVAVVFGLGLLVLLVTWVTRSGRA